MSGESRKINKQCEMKKMESERKKVCFLHLHQGLRLNSTNFQMQQLMTFRIITVILYGNVGLKPHCIGLQTNFIRKQILYCRKEAVIITKIQSV